jgi:hypothetical protein
MIILLISSIVIISLIYTAMIIPTPVIITVSAITTKPVFANCKLAKLANGDFYIIVPKLE